jgi:hypothetical protein
VVVVCDCNAGYHLVRWMDAQCEAGPTREGEVDEEERRGEERRGEEKRGEERR